MAKGRERPKKEEGVSPDKQKGLRTHEKTGGGGGSVQLSIGTIIQWKKRVKGEREWEAKWRRLPKGGKKKVLRGP